MKIDILAFGRHFETEKVIFPFYFILLYFNFICICFFFSSQVFFIPNCVAIMNFWAICSLGDPSWPLHDLWLYQCTTLYSRVLPNKFRCHWAFLSNLIPADPLCDLWPQQCFKLWSGFLSTKFGGHRALLKQLDLWMTVDLGWGHFENML